MTVSHDQLSAYLDGELPPEEMKSVAAAIAADDELRARAEALAASDVLLKRAYSAIDDSPMPDAVTALLKAPAGKVVPLRRPQAAPRWAMPLAASVALGAGLALGLFLNNPVRMAPSGGVLLAGAINPADPLDAALDKTPSGDRVAIAGAREVSLVLSFETADGRYCREFTLEDAQSAARAIACREDGLWSVKIAAAEEKSAGGYATAASGVSAAFDAGARALGANEPLDRAREDALLKAGWTGGAD